MTLNTLLNKIETSSNCATEIYIYDNETSELEFQNHKRDPIPLTYLLKEIADFEVRVDCWENEIVISVYI